MLKRFLVVLLLAGFTLPARATDYSDMWYLPAESGWGVNLTQNESVIFMTFFVYGTDGKPTWYVAIAYEDANGNFSGTLYSTTGTYFGAPWGGFTATAAGTASFSPINAYQGTLSYTLTSGPTVTKSIERQSLTTITLGGNYTGGQSGAYSTCGDASLNGEYTDTYTLNIAQSNGSATLTFTYNLAGATCTLTGALEQRGQLYRIPTATYQCTGGLSYTTTAIIEELKATSLGIEGRFAATLPDTGCRETASFSAVLF
jgi:hypothetical protein